MATANEDLFDALVKHRIDLEMLSRTTVRDLWKLLDSTNDEIEHTLRRLVDEQETTGNKKTIAALFALLFSKRSDSIDSASTRLDEFSAEFAQGEPQFFIDTFDEVVPVEVPIKTINQKELNNEIPKLVFGGLTLAQWMKNLKQTDETRIRTQINLGIIANEPVDKILKRIFGTRALNFGDGALQKTKQDLQVITNTVINGISSNILASLAEGNPALFTYERYTAVLDSRTTILCASLDGNKYPIGEGPIPPLHPNCRSIRVPVLDASGMAKYAAKLSTRAELQRLSARDREKVINRILGKFSPSTYTEFLRKQSTEFQDRVLGKTRARLWRAGKIKDLGAFVAPSGSNFTLAELRRQGKL